MKSLNEIKEKTQNKICGFAKKAVAMTRFLVAIGAFMLVPCYTTYAGIFDEGETVTVNTGADPQTVVNNIVTLITRFGRIVGVFVLVGGVITYIYGYIENNPSTQSKSYPMIGGGLALFGLGTLINMIFGGK